MPDRDEIMKQMAQTLAEQNKPEYLTEVAMPGVVQPVDKTNVRDDMFDKK